MAFEINGPNGFNAEAREGTPADAHVGGQMRLRRIMLGMTQEQVAERLGISFQQVQKYERGINRIGASRLYQIARLLDVPLSFFFEDLIPEQTSVLSGKRSDTASPERGDDDLIRRRETLELVRAYYRITDADARRRLLDLIKSIAAPDA
jgi:transcriptional regulator with XRE-family HTH domain